MIPPLVIEVHLKRWMSHLVVVLSTTGLVWCFCYSLRAFFRSEPLHLHLLFLLFLKTLPAILPFVVAVSTLFTIVQMRKRREWHLCDLLGLSPLQRHFILIPTWLCVGLFSMALENTWKPVIKQEIQRVALAQQIKAIEARPSLEMGPWVLFKKEDGRWLIKGENMVSRCRDLEAKEGVVLLRDGTQWNFQQPEQTLRFGELQIPLETESQPRDNSLIYLFRVLTLPAIMYALGYALGLRHERKGFKSTFLLSFTSLFLIYYPSTIPGKGLQGATPFEVLLLFLPHLIVVLWIGFLHWRASRSSVAERVWA